MQAPGQEVETIIRGEVSYTAEELNDFANSAKQKSEGYVSEQSISVG